MRDAVGRRKQRPRCDELKQRNVEGLKDLVDLMNKCWAQEPSERPKSKGTYSLWQDCFHSRTFALLDEIDIHIFITMRPLLIKTH